MQGYVLSPTWYGSISSPAWNCDFGALQATCGPIYLPWRHFCLAVPWCSVRIRARHPARWTIPRPTSLTVAHWLPDSSGKRDSNLSFLRRTRTNCSPIDRWGTRPRSTSGTRSCAADYSRRSDGRPLRNAGDWLTVSMAMIEQDPAPTCQAFLKSLWWRPRGLTCRNASLGKYLVRELSGTFPRRCLRHIF